jgi:hypothetical protein
MPQSPQFRQYPASHSLKPGLIAIGGKHVKASSQLLQASFNFVT